MRPALVLILALMMGMPQVHAAGDDSTYQVEITATLSPAVNFFRGARVPGTSGSTSLGCGASVRVLWHPGRLLAFGLHTGCFLLANDEIGVVRGTSTLTYDATLYGIPLQLALSMQKHGFEAGMGIGPYLMISTIEGGNSAPVRGQRLELGMTFFAAYTFALGDDLSIGPELRVVSMRYRGIISVMPSISLRTIPLRY